MSRVANLALSLPMTRSQTDTEAVVSIADDPADTFCRFYSRSSDVVVVSLDSWLSWKWVLLTETSVPSSYHIRFDPVDKRTCKPIPAHSPPRVD